MGLKKQKGFMMSKNVLFSSSLENHLYWCLVNDIFVKVIKNGVFLLLFFYAGGERVKEPRNQYADLKNL